MEEERARVEALPWPEDMAAEWKERFAEDGPVRALFLAILDTIGEDEQCITAANISVFVIGRLIDQGYAVMSIPPELVRALRAGIDFPIEGLPN